MHELEKQKDYSQLIKNIGNIVKLKRYVLIDLKLPDVKHHDIGQMNMYLGYFAKEENEETDNKPIGILLTREKDEVMIEYAMYDILVKLKQKLVIVHISFFICMNTNQL